MPYVSLKSTEALSFTVYVCRWFWRQCWVGFYVQYWQHPTLFQTTPTTGATMHELTLKLVSWMKPTGFDFLTHVRAC